MDLSNRTALELHFAENFSTVLFPVLAQSYFSDGDFIRAKKVCEIGLEYHPKHADGLFILSECEKIGENFTLAEKYLKEISLSGSTHIPAAVSLGEVQTKLKRPPAILSKTWKYVLELDPSNEQASRELDQLKEEKAEPIKAKTASTISKQSPKPKPIKESLAQTRGKTDISPSLATFTMVTVLCNQGLHHQALSVLDALEAKGENENRIANEREKIMAEMDNVRVE